MTAASLPNGWAFLTLENFTSNENNAIKRGPFGSAIKKEYFVPSGYKVYEQKNAIYNDFNIGNYFINESKFQELKDFAVKPGDIIISCSGTIGKLAIIPQNAPKGIINQALLKLSLDTRIILTKYFSYLFTSDFFQKKVLKNTRGTAIKNLESVKALKQIPFPIAPLNEQKRIINKVELLFSFLDTGVAQLRLVQGQLKRYRQAVLKAAFEGKLTQQWRKEQKDQLEPAQQLLERIIKAKEETSKTKFDNQIIINGSEKHLELPVSWVWTKLGKIISVHSGEGLTTRQMQKDGQYPVYGGNGVSGHYSKYLFEDSRVIIGRVGAKCGVVHITAPKSWVTDNALVVDTWYMNLKFLYYSLSNLNLNQFSVSTAQPVISSTKIYPLNFKLPPLMEQEQIVREIEYRLSIADETNKLNLTIFKQADKLRQCVLKSAFEGRLVPQNPADEPAERLLERIKAQQLTRKSKNNNQVELSKYVK